MQIKLLSIWKVVHEDSFWNRGKKQLGNGLLTVEKPRQLQWPITANVNNKTNQWELEANGRNRRQARENACDQGAIGFGLAFDWLRRWREFLNQS